MAFGFRALEGPWRRHEEEVLTFFGVFIFLRRQPAEAGSLQQWHTYVGWDYAKLCGSQK
jgi:hypothetical protein